MINDRGMAIIGFTLSIALALCWGFDRRMHRQERDALLSAIQQVDEVRLPETSAEPRELMERPARAMPPAPAVQSPEPVPVLAQMPEEALPHQEAAQGTWVEQFDRAMDREFQRLEARERQTEDAAEIAVLGEIKVALEDLDEVWRQLDALDPASEERVDLVARAQETMGSVIRLAATDRNLRLSRMAHSLGLEEEHEITLFISELDQIFRETHLDWSKLFIRGF